MRNAWIPLLKCVCVHPERAFAIPALVNLSSTALGVFDLCGGFSDTDQSFKASLPELSDLAMTLLDLWSVFQTADSLPIVCDSAWSLQCASFQ